METKPPRNTDCLDHAGSTTPPVPSVLPSSQCTGEPMDRPRPSGSPSDVAVPPAGPVLPVSSPDRTIRPAVYQPPASALCVSANAAPPVPPGSHEQPRALPPLRRPL